MDRGHARGLRERREGGRGMRQDGAAVGEHAGERGPFGPGGLHPFSKVKHCGQLCVGGGESGREKTLLGELCSVHCSGMEEVEEQRATGAKMRR